MIILTNKILLIGGIILIALIGVGVYLFTRMDTTLQNSILPPNQDSKAETSVDEATDSTESAEESAIKEIIVESRGLVFNPEEIKVKMGDTVKLTYKNNQGTHDWNVDEFNAKTGLIDAGEEKTVEFVADKPGSFEYYCSVPGHREAGLKGTLIVE